MSDFRFQIPEGTGARHRNVNPGGRGITFVGADVPRDDRNMAIEVRFASDQSYDYHDDDDYDDALHGYGDNTLDDGVGAEGSEPDYEDDFFGDDDF